MIVVSIKKKKYVNKNIVATIIYRKCKDGLLNNKCLSHLMNRTQSKDYKIGTYQINKMSLSCFDDKIYFVNNGYYGLVLANWS